MDKNYSIIIDKSEYDELLEMAKLNEEQIRQKAIELWEKEGQVKLMITLQLKSARRDIEGYDQYQFDNYNYISEYGKFTIPCKLKERLQKIIKCQTEQLMCESFGKNLLHLNKIIDLEREHEKLIKRYKVFTLTGWLAALLIIVVATGIL